MRKCYRCGAEYKPGDWVTVRYEQGTNGAYQVLGAIPDDQCPICRLPPSTAKPEEIRPM